MRKRVFMISVLILAFCLMTVLETQADSGLFSDDRPDSMTNFETVSGTDFIPGNRTVYYLPYASFSTSENSQLIFLGTVETTVCEEKNQISFTNNIAYEFTQHVEAYYKSDLGTWHRWNERIGYWRFDSSKELVSLRARLAKRYPSIVSVSDFRWVCD